MTTKQIKFKGIILVYYYYYLKNREYLVAFVINFGLIVSIIFQIIGILYIKRNKRYLIQSRKCKYKLNVKHSLDAEKAKSAIFLLLKCKSFALIVIYLNFEIYMSFFVEDSQLQKHFQEV